MKKKQIIGLCTLLLVLLLGLFTTSYADVNRTWTDTELKNILYKMAMNNNPNYSSTYVNLINSKSTEIQTIVNELNEYDFNAVGAKDDNSCLFIKITNLSGWYVYRNQPVTVTSWYKVYTILLDNNNISISSSISDNSSSFVWGDYRYIGRNTYNNSSWGYIVWGAGEYYPDNFFDEWYYESSKPIYFDMEEYAAQQYVDVEFVGDDKLTYNYSDIPLYSLPTKTSEVYFGNLYNEELATLTEDRFAVIYWYNNKWVAKTLDSRILNNYATSSPFLNISTNDLLEYTYSQIGRYVVKDCFYFYSIDDSDGNRAVALWYVESSNTVISGDKIDPSTFDNNDNYNNEVQNLIDKIDNIDNIIAGTEPIIDTITNDEDVSGELAAFISGDADDLAAKFGYNPIENPFTTVVLDIVQQLTDVLLGSGNATIDLSNHGINWVINSRDIYLPPGRITTFIHLMCNAWFIWGIYKYGFQLYQWIQSGRLQNLVNETNRHQYFLF